MKWIEVHDPEMNDRLRYVPSDSIEMIIPHNQGHCYVTLKTRPQQWKVKLSAVELMSWIEP